MPSKRLHHMKRRDSEGDSAPPTKHRSGIVADFRQKFLASRKLEETADLARSSPELYHPSEKQSRTSCSKSTEDVSQKAPGRKLLNLFEYHRHQPVEYHYPDDDRPECIEETTIIFSDQPETVYRLRKMSQGTSSAENHREIVAEIRAKWQIFKVLFFMLHGMSFGMIALQYIVYDNEEIIKRLLD